MFREVKYYIIDGWKNNMQEQRNEDFGEGGVLNNGDKLFPHRLLVVWYDAIPEDNRFTMFERSVDRQSFRNE